MGCKPFHDFLFFHILVQNSKLIGHLIFRTLSKLVIFLSFLGGVGGQLIIEVDLYLSIYGTQCFIEMRWTENKGNLKGYVSFL